MSMSLWLYVPHDREIVVPDLAAADEFMEQWFGQDYLLSRTDEPEGVRYWCRTGASILNAATLTERGRRCGPADDRPAPVIPRAPSWWDRFVQWCTT